MSTTVRAKFFVSKVDPAEGTSAAATVTMGAVCRGIENAMWAQATPWANLTMGIKNDAAVPLFEQGEEYEVTFRKVEKPKPGDGHPIKQATAAHGNIVCETCGMHLGSTMKWGEMEPGIRDENVKAHNEHYASTSGE